MSDMSASRHVSYEQVKMIVDFMGQHVDFAIGGLRSLEARHTSKRLWGELTKSLNNCRGGTRKTSDGWSKYWSDFKNKLKNKSRILKRNKSGSSFKKGFKPLTKLEKRALIILGPHFDKRKNRVEQVVDPISDLTQPKVKQESYHETLKNDYENELNDTSDRISGGDRDSEQSMVSSDEDFVDDTYEVPNSHLLQNLYPKWLIEVEKKRVDAELLRAKAEQQRASVAVKNAEAAIIQAEALKKLSEAATRQADAMSRIAILLENQRSRDVLLNI